jgi:hypothetical protein
VLLNILPGLRELRAPLAAGYLWLVVGWLALGDSISFPDEAHDFLDQFSGLGEAAALTFGAYIVGSFFSDALAPVWGSLRKARLRWSMARLLQRDVAQFEAEEAELEAESAARISPVHIAERENWLTYRKRISHTARVASDVATEPLSVRGLGGIASLVVLEPPMTLAASTSAAGGWDDFGGESERGGWDDARAAVAIARELDIARFRLLSEQPDLFSEADRLRGEGQFRLAVVAPLVALVVTLGVSEQHISRWWEYLASIAVLASIGVLARQGLDRLEESGDRVVDALRAGKVSIPALEGEPAPCEGVSKAEPPARPTPESPQGEWGETSAPPA